MTLGLSILIATALVSTWLLFANDRKPKPKQIRPMPNRAFGLKPLFKITFLCAVFSWLLTLRDLGFRWGFGMYASALLAAFAFRRYPLGLIWGSAFGAIAGSSAAVATFPWTNSIIDIASSGEVLASLPAGLLVGTILCGLKFISERTKCDSAFGIAPSETNIDQGSQINVT